MQIYNIHNTRKPKGVWYCDVRPALHSCNVLLSHTPLPPRWLASKELWIKTRSCLKRNDRGEQRRRKIDNNRHLKSDTMQGKPVLGSCYEESRLTSESKFWLRQYLTLKTTKTTHKAYAGNKFWNGTQHPISKVFKATFCNVIDIWNYTKGIAKSVSFDFKSCQKQPPSM